MQKKKHQQGCKNSQFGKERSEETKAKMRKSLAKQPIIKCSFCEVKSKNKAVMNRWHFNNCKFSK